MKTLFGILCALILVAAAVLWLGTGQRTSAEPVQPAASMPSFTVAPMRQGVLYDYRLPATLSDRVRVAISQNRALVSDFYQQAGQPELVVNAGFFDPTNHQTTSYVTVNGRLQADPAQNGNLTGNPRLQKYLPLIFNRTEFRIYQCDNGIRTDIVPHAAQPPAGCRIRDAVGGGPRLLPGLTAQPEGFVDYNSAGKTIRDPIGVCKPNARTVLGLTPTGDLIILVGAQHPDDATSGFTLEEMARLLKARGAVKGMNLDGGGSSSLVYQGTAYYGEFEKDGTPVRRPVKSVLLIRGP